MSVPYKNPISSVQVSTPQSVSRTSVFGTNFSILNVGGYMEVYNLSDLSLTLTASTYPSLIQLSANTIPIRYTKGNGTFLSPDYLTLNSDNISSGRRRLGMLVYVHETDTVYQYVIPNYDTLWNNMSGLTGFSSVTYSDYTTVINNRSSAGQSFISGWTSSNIEGVSGFTSANSNWRVYLPGGSTSGLYLPLSGGTVYGPTIFSSGVTANTISATSINKVDYIIFNTGTTSATTVAGTIYFDNTEKALSYNTSINQGVTVNLGQQNYLRVFNNSGLDIQKGKVVELLSSYSGLPAVILAVNRFLNDRDVVGVAAETIPNNSEGIVLTYGIISNITVTGGSIGSLVYASDTNPGEIKNATEFNTFPLTARTNSVGYIIQTGTTTGKIFVNPVNENSTLSLTELQRNVLEGNVISTGVFNFSGITLASSSTFNVGAVDAWLVDNTTDPLRPVVSYIEYSGQTNIPSLYYSSATETYLLLTSTATITQQTTFPTPQQRRESVYLGKMGHGNRTSLINAFNEPDLEVSPLSQLRDMFTPIKLINENVYPSPNTGLTFNTSSGTLWGLGIGFLTNKLNPSSLSVSGNSPTTFQYRTQTGGTATNRTTIDPANYDLNGIITSIGSPAKQATNQRIFLLQNGQFRIQYGQTKYTDLTTAIAAVNTEAFTTFSNFRDNAILIAILSVRSDATILTDTLQAKITFASKFGETVGGTGGISTTTLQQAYNNSSNPEIVTNSAEGALSIKNGTGNADNVTRLLEGLDTAGNTTSFIRADGDISGTTLQTSSFTANSTGLSATTISATTYQNLPILPYLPLSGGTITGPTVMNYSQPLTLVATNYSPGSSGSILYFLTETSSGYTSINSRGGGGGIGGDLILQNFSNNVGIGTTTPNYKLEVNGSIGATSVSAETMTGVTFLSKGTYGSTTINASNNQSMIVFSGSNTVGGTGYTDFIKVINTAAGATNINKTIRVNNTGNIEFINSTYNATIFTIGDNGVITINSPASVTSNSATNNAINIGTKGQLFDDGNLHIHSSSGAVWINALDGSAIRLGTQTNTGNSPVIVDTTTVGHSFFTKVQSGFNVAFGTEITMDNLKVRINGTGGSGGLVQAGAVSGSFAAYTTLVGNVAGSAIQGDTNSGGITFTTTYQNISGVQKTLSAGGDTTTLHLIDTTNSRIYRITAIHCQGTTGGYTSIERMS